MGTPEFAVATLEALLKNNFNVVGVVTVADKPAGRGQQVQQSAVKVCALKHNLKLLQPVSLKDEAFINELRELNADLQIVVAFRMLPEIVWNMPKHGTYNLHASLLPKYRGAAPINWAIINGEKVSGVTTFKLVHEIDAGNILFQEEVKISDTATAGELHDGLKEVGSKLMIKTVDTIIESEKNKTELHFTNQVEDKITHAPKLFKETCKINFNKSCKEVNNLIRGLSPYPAAYTVLVIDGRKINLKIFEAEYKIELLEKKIVGKISTDNKTFLKIHCADGYISLKHLQLEGKKRMGVDELLRGFKLNDAAFCD